MMNRKFNHFDSIFDSEEKNVLLKSLKNKKNWNKLTLKELFGNLMKYYNKLSCLSENETNDLLIEEFIINHAHSRNKKLISLESLEEIIKEINKNPINIDLINEIKLISFKINNKRYLQENECSATREYRNYKIDYEFNIKKSSPLLTYRNKKWIKILNEHFKETQNIFVIVGYAHLKYRNGIIKSLKKIGYKVKPIKI